MMLAVPQWSTKVDLSGPPEFFLSVLRWSTGGIGKKMTDRQWPATDGATLMVHCWTISGQPLWFNAICPPANQQWHLVAIADRQNSGGPLVAATSELLMACLPRYVMKITGRKYASLHAYISLANNHFFLLCYAKALYEGNRRYLSWHMILLVLYLHQMKNNHQLSLRNKTLTMI
jgi:hypothetical protein